MGFGALPLQASPRLFSDGVVPPGMKCKRGGLLAPLSLLNEKFMQ